MAHSYKMKTNKASAKRFSFTGTGKIRRKKAGLRHFMRRKNSSSKRNLRNRAYVAKSNEKAIKQLMPYG